MPQKGSTKSPAHVLEAKAGDNQKEKSLMFSQDCILKIIPDSKSTVLYYYCVPTFFFFASEAKITIFFKISCTFIYLILITKTRIKITVPTKFIENTCTYNDSFGVEFSLDISVK